MWSNDVRVTIDLRRSPSGTIEGIVRREDTDGRIPFHGIIELVVALETFLDTKPPEEATPRV